MQITDRDWAQLSAYLDGELSGRELIKVRKKIQTDPLFQAALEQLKITKQILQSAPRIPAPRNFTLTPEMVGVKPKNPSFSRFRLAAALMSFLLIGVMILDFGGTLSLGAMSAEFSPKSIEAQLESIPEIAADAVQEPALLEAVGEVAEEQVVAEYTEDFANAGAPAVEAEAVEEVLAEGVAEKGQEEEPQDTDAATETNRAQGGDDLEPTVQAWASQTPEPLPAVIEYYPDDEIHEPEGSDGISILRILEILFGLGVIGFSAAAWTKRRKSH